MKILFFSLAIIFSLANSKSVLSCSPAFPFTQQKFDLDKALESEEFQLEMTRQMEANFQVKIQSIEFAPGVTFFNLNNACVIKVKSKYTEPTDDGMCPRFIGVVVKTKCGLRTE